MALVKNHRYFQSSGFGPKGYAGSSWDSLALFGLTRSAVNSSYRAAPLQEVGHDGGGNLRTVRDERTDERRWLPPESRIAVPQKVTAYKKPRVGGHIRKNGRLAIVPVCSYVRGRARAAIRTGVIFSDEPYYPDVKTSPADMVIEGAGDYRAKVGKSRFVYNEKTGEKLAKFTGPGKTTRKPIQTTIVR